MKTLLSALAVTAAMMTSSAMITPAWADPAGTYSVSGTNPGESTTYEGTVKITKTGETYRVQWKVADDTFNGTAIGNDDILSVGYDSGGKPGVGLFVKQDGKWTGIWSYLGEKATGTEVWTK